MYKKVNKFYIWKQLKEVGEIETSICSREEDVNYFMNTHFEFMIRSKEDLERAEECYRKNSDSKRLQYAIWIDEEEDNATGK